MVSWLDRLQRRSRAAGFAIAVAYKYVDDKGGYLAAPRSAASRRPWGRSPTTCH